MEPTWKCGCTAVMVENTWRISKCEEHGGRPLGDKDMVELTALSIRQAVGDTWVSEDLIRLLVAAGRAGRPLNAPMLQDSLASAVKIIDDLREAHAKEIAELNRRWEHQLDIAQYGHDF